MKKSIKKVLIIAITILLVFSLISTVDASMAGIIKQNFTGNAGSEGSNAIKQILTAILDVIRTAGAGVAVVILMTIAAKYIMASAGDRADIKKYAVNYVIGAIILFGASGILTIVKKFIDASVK